MIFPGNANYVGKITIFIIVKVNIKNNLNAILL